MHIGHYISAAGHGAVLGWALLADMLAPPLPEPQITPVQVISESEFAALMADLPSRAPSETPAEEAAQPLAVAVPQIAALPALEAVQSEAAEDDLPQQSSPAPVPPTPVLPAPPAVATTAPPPPKTPEAHSAAPADIQPTAPQSAPQPQDNIPSDDGARRPPAPAQGNPAPSNETASPDLAVATDSPTLEASPASRPPASPPRPQLRPQLRPEPPPSAEPEEPPAEQPDSPETPDPPDPLVPEPPTPPPSERAQPDAETSNQDAINAALLAALAAPAPDPSPAPTSAPSGPSLSEGERDAFRLAVQDCWIVDAGSQAARVTVSVGFSLERNGTIANNEVRLLSHDGGVASDAAVRAAFASARRAVLRCQRQGGYDLPIEKYAHWRDTELTFNPENMRIR